MTLIDYLVYIGIPLIMGIFFGWNLGSLHIERKKLKNKIKKLKKDIYENHF